MTSVASLSHEKSLSAGGSDRTLRVWKMTEESQLVFNGVGNHGSIECAALINDGHFVSGAENG